VAIPQHIRQPKVRNLEVCMLRVTIGCEQQVFWLQVPVHHTCIGRNCCQQQPATATALELEQQQGAGCILVMCSDVS
jgi:hypothetical protein